MVPNPYAVVARAVAAVTALAVLAGPATAASARDGDGLPGAATQALAALHMAHADAAIAAAGGASLTDAAVSMMQYDTEIAAVAALVAPRTSVEAGAFVGAWQAAGP